MSRPNDSSTAPTGATPTRVYTVTVQASCTVTVVVESSSPVRAGTWMRDVAIPNGLASLGPLEYDWTTAKATWDDGEEPTP